MSRAAASSTSSPTGWWPGIASGYAIRYTPMMKTAISLPDKVYADAEAYRAQHGTPRSELYARAIAEYVRRRRHEEMAEAIDRMAPEDLEPDPVLMEIQYASLGAEKW